MKKLMLLLSLTICIFTSCKKTGVRYPGYIADDFPIDTAYKNLKAILKGTWVVAGTPILTTDPYSSTITFSDSSMVSFTNFTGSTVKAPYKISVENGIYYLTINSDKVIRRCKVEEADSFRIKLLSVIGATNPLTIEETFVPQ